MNIAAVESSYEAWAESINPWPGHILEINGIDSPSTAEMRPKILQAFEMVRFSGRPPQSLKVTADHESR